MYVLKVLPRAEDTQNKAINESKFPRKFFNIIFNCTAVTFFFRSSEGYKFVWLLATIS